MFNETFANEFVPTAGASNAEEFLFSQHSTSTSQPSIFKGYTDTFAAALCPASPLTGSHCHPCHGHTTLPPSTKPCPNGPPRWRHRLSMALKVPLTLATQITFPAQENSLASFSAGSSPCAAIFVKSGMQKDYYIKNVIPKARVLLREPTLILPKGTLRFDGEHHGRSQVRLQQWEIRVCFLLRHLGKN
jgi:hypothetical protein